MSRGYEVLAKVEATKAFHSLPALFELAATFLESPSEAIRTSAQQFIISLIINCIPQKVILRPTGEDTEVLKKLAKIVTQLLSVRYQGAWMEVFDVVGVFLENLRWRANPLLIEAVKTIGDLRSNEGFHGKIQADSVLGYAIHAMGPQAVLTALPLNLAKPAPGQPGRAWMLPLLRDHVSNTNLAHFISEFVPLSEMIFQKVVDNTGSEKTMEIKIYETLVQQIWAILPGYCDSPLDLQKVNSVYHNVRTVALTGMIVFRSIFRRTPRQRSLPASRPSFRRVQGSREPRKLQQAFGKHR
jgi:ribosomal RNA-processing protein 12